MGMELYTYMINSTMGKTTHGTKLFVRFLRERGIKYAYAEETLRNAYRRYERKRNSKFLNDMNGDLLKYFDSFFSLGVYKVIYYSFIWNYTKKATIFGLEWKENGNCTIPHK